MATTTEVKFSCKQCGREFRWKPEIAGKQAKCKCGATVTVPKTPPPPPPPLPPLPKEEEAGADLDGLYALAAAEQNAAPVDQGYRCPSCGTGLPVGATMCPGCGVELGTGKRASTRAAGVAGAGVVGAKAAPAKAGGGGGARALSVAKTALVTTGKVIDTAYMIQLWIKRIILAVVVLVVIVLIIVNKFRSGSGGGGGRYGSDDDTEDVRPQTPAEQRKDLDSSAMEALKEDHATEARAWLKKGGDRAVFNLGKDKSLSTVNELYTMGAKQVTASGFVDDEAAIATILVIELPADPEARKKLFDWADRTEKKLADASGDEHEATKDVGQKYLEVNFDNT